MTETIPPPDEDNGIPKWKLDLIAEVQRLIQAKEANQKTRQDWLDTQPPEIKNTSIGR